MEVMIHKRNNSKCEIKDHYLDDGTPFRCMTIEIDRNLVSFFDLEFSDLENIKKEIERYLKEAKENGKE